MSQFIWLLRAAIFRSNVSTFPREMSCAVGSPQPRSNLTWAKYLLRVRARRETFPWHQGVTSFAPCAGYIPKARVAGRRTFAQTVASKGRVSLFNWRWKCANRDTTKVMLECWLWIIWNDEFYVVTWHDAFLQYTRSNGARCVSIVLSKSVSHSVSGCSLTCGYIYIKRIFALVACGSFVRGCIYCWDLVCNARVCVALRELRLLSLCVTFFNSLAGFEPFKALHLCKFREYIFGRERALCVIIYAACRECCRLACAYALLVLKWKWNWEVAMLCDWSRQFNELRWV